ncbi:alpha-glucan family phosphorylase [Candidatus Binatia bacterium]|nr:alpha-glucan family phosphorylase [Candidatus Binatia bacterium]
MFDQKLHDSLPETLRPLVRMAANLWWSWNGSGMSLFRDIDPQRWDLCEHNPLELLRTAAPERLSQMAVDPDYLERIQKTVARFDEYMRAKPGTPRSESFPTWAREHLPQASADRPIAYFCAEYGIHESLHLYAGGLGILAGDHLKSASDLGIPLVAIGLLYRQGYFRQRVNVDGWQEEFYSDEDFRELPLTLLRDETNQPLTVEVPIRGRSVCAQIWRADVGRVPLFLLDTDCDRNEDIDRWITAHLYGGDASTRIVQEVVLGIGGVRALRALGITPHAYHLNEGHSAFLTLELIREQVTTGVDLDTAAKSVAQQCVFTTHTPVPAGNDTFDAALMQEVLGTFLKEVCTDTETVLGLGRRHPNDTLEPFGMTPLAIRLSRSANGVSKRHGEVCARMWQQLWPDVPVEESPFKAVTNGVHHSTWVAPLMRRLFDHFMGPDWALHADDPEMWKRVDQIPDGEMWRAHCLLRARLVAEARYRAEMQWREAGESEQLVRSAKRLLNPDILTIGFARRVAAYKRWHLLLADMERAIAMLNHPTQPVQFVLAGKAHPRDNEAKRILQQLMQWKERRELRGRVVFLSGYDQYVARRLVQGVDVWLNLPVPPLEASGTSGMKVVVNGGLNCSILDGWWIEGSNGENGWDVGAPYDLPSRGRMVADDRNNADAASLHDIIENQIRPLFYDRNREGVPRGWVARMRASMKTLAPAFSATRMVKDYAHIYYPE